MLPGVPSAARRCKDDGRRGLPGLVARGIVAERASGPSAKGGGSARSRQWYDGKDMLQIVTLPARKKGRAQGAMKLHAKHRWEQKTC